ncbi:hypothetical protein ICN46_07660 [Polynucleobacter sp. Latsch14-2]|jgi:uncharacterized protein YneF (UPF0154 family)|uniref:hypothetical protein n=1 Tax=Polynucleobacter sp. Latsch14-2 TaxID=2576920 RepID=UPI001C0C5393|nr:hypothetical protein [Polynucleobacter sp. Latsch14-2]MBU3614769.1 hypothetical protein [Polynucleobacter sp. Latsch14-2]
MNLADVSIADIIIFIFKVFIAIVIIAWIIGMIGGFAKFLADIGKLFQSILSDLFPIIFNSLGSVFNSIWRHLIKIGFRNSFWNLVPLLWVFIEIFTAILSLLFSRPNSTNFWPWWKYALPGVIVFGATLAINIMIGKYLANRGMSSKLENNSCDNFTIEEMPIEDHDIGHNEESNPLEASNLYCYQCTKKLGLVSKKHRGFHYCDACYLYWADRKKW